jgi:hypothetical protein
MCNYPKSIIPQKNFTNINIDELKNKFDNVIMVRRSLCSSENDTFDSTGKANANAIVKSGSQLKDLSMNLLGGGYSVENLRFSVKKDEKWKQGVDVVFEDFENRIEEKESYVPIFFKLNDFHKIEFPFYNSAKDKLIDHFSTKKKESPAITAIEHDPTHGNFWHIELVTRKKNELQQKQKFTTPKETDKEKIPDGKQYISYQLYSLLRIKCYRKCPKAISEIPSDYYIV